MIELYQIYLITDLTNNKKYVGQAVKKRQGYLRRFKEHIRGANYSNCRLLSNAIKKHGADNFKVELLEDNIPQDEIDKKEIYYINYYDTFNNGYNMTLGGQGVHQYVHTEQTRQKISESSKAQWENLKSNPDKLSERNSKISKALKGKEKTQEHKQHLSDFAKRRFESEPGTFKGKHHTQESKQKNAEKHRKCKVAAFYKDTQELFKIFDCASDASKYLNEQGITKNKSAYTRILKICEGKDKSAYGYVWKFYEEGVSTIPAGSRVEIVTTRSALSNIGE